MSKVSITLKDFENQKLNETYESFEEELKEKKAELERLESTLEWHNQFNLGVHCLEYERILNDIDIYVQTLTELKEKLTICEEKNKKNSLEKRNLEESIELHQKKHIETKININTFNKIFNKNKYRQAITDALKYRQIIEKYKQKLDKINKQKLFCIDDIKYDIDKKEQIINQLNLLKINFEEDLAYYNAIDVPTKKNIKKRIKELKKNIEELNLETKYYGEKKNMFYQDAQSIIKKAEEAIKDRDEAEEMNDALSNSSNGYERSIIHEKCKERFGEGSPNHIIKKREQKLEQLKRSFDKKTEAIFILIDQEKKAEYILQNIKTLLIDGNNLCYKNGNEKIGLGALVALTNYLIKNINARIIVIFDPKADSFLNMEQYKIKQKFPSSVNVEFPQAGRKADETLIDYADGDSSCYIMSNDQYAEYYNREVIQNDRVLRHEIITGIINIPSLNIKKVKY